MIQPDFNIGVGLGIVIGFCIQYVNTAITMWLERKRGGKNDLLY